MKRLTIKSDTDVTVPESDRPEAARRLAAFEDAYEKLANDLITIPAELAKLKAAGKEKTVRYRELFGQKLINSQIKCLFEEYGIPFD